MPNRYGIARWKLAQDKRGASIDCHHTRSGRTHYRCRYRARCGIELPAIERDRGRAGLQSESVQERRRVVDDPVRNGLRQSLCGALARPQFEAGPRTRAGAANFHAIPYRRERRSDFSGGRRHAHPRCRRRSHRRGRRDRRYRRPRRGACGPRHPRGGTEDRRRLRGHGPPGRFALATLAGAEGIMQIGLFDHVEHGDRPLTQLFDERLRFAEAADDAGIYCLHVAEHHATPLNMVPVPGVYLGAVARATRRMRLGPLVYLLPLYSPLRLIEEICMLDHLSYGRLEVGVGRGVSPFELKYHKVAHDKSRDIFIDAFECISAGLTADTLTYSGKYHQYENVPIALRPLQQPHPPFWYGSSNTTGATWAGEHGMHFVSLGPTPFAKTNIDAFKQALAKRGGPAQPKAEFSGGTAIGVLRHIFVADTDAEAKRFGKPAMELHLAQLNWLRDKHGVTGLTSRLNVPRGATFEDCVADGSVIAGTPQRVQEEIERQVAELGVNYLLTYLFMGAMSLPEAMRSLQLFSSEVMPKLAQL